MAIMHFVAGPGTMPKAEVKAVLNDLWVAEDNLTPTGQPVGIYFVLEAQVDPGEGHQSIVEWMHEQGLTYYVISPPGQAPHVLYNGAAQVMDGAAISPFIYAQSAVAQGMPVNLLALFVDPSNENPLDAQLVQTVESFTDAGYPAKAMNAQMWDLAMTQPQEAVVDPAQTAVAQLPQAAPVAPAPAPAAPAMPAPVDQTALPPVPSARSRRPPSSRTARRSSWRPSHRRRSTRRSRPRPTPTSSSWPPSLPRRRSSRPHRTRPRSRLRPTRARRPPRPRPVVCAGPLTVSWTR
jgi:hypothetical protein